MDLSEKVEMLEGLADEIQRSVARDRVQRYVDAFRMWAGPNAGEWPVAAKMRTPEGDVQIRLEDLRTLLEAVPPFKIPATGEDPMATLDRRVLQAWADAELLERDYARDSEPVKMARAYAMGLSVAAQAVGRPEEVWASPERAEAVRARIRETQALSERLTGLAEKLEADRDSEEYAGGHYARDVLTDVVARMRKLLKGRA